MRKLSILIITSLFFGLQAHAANPRVEVMLTSKAQTPIGKVQFEETTHGLLITPHLAELPPGVHGFHIHQHPSCEDAGMSAGGHFDPAQTNTHQGPYGAGHLGDLPVLIVDETGHATLPMLAPRLKIADLAGHTLMIHAGADNYTDTPANGGGGARMACGIIQ